MKADNVADASGNMNAGGGASQRLLDNLGSALCAGALPGELKHFGDEDCRAAAEFVAGCAGKRQRGTALVRIESTGTRLGQRRMRICVVNDDMPFLVDSVAQAIAARGLIIHRLFHPVVCVTRDADGTLEALEPLCDDKDRRESMMYLEVDRDDARGRRDLAAGIQRVLADVRAVVADWQAMQAQMRRDAEDAEGEGRALLEWFADGAMTLLGYEVERPDGPPS
ncbi:MAG: NAD-glutamate dehydrogenase, partial [Alphaproteobacteria bacterium]|nr:NAD-glutamate dehydrogenase [Alphaproteobacteria bacterium]